jgi:uncharacterized protein (TIGR02118 family)
MELIALYAQPDDPQAFDEAYFETHVPLIRKVPGLQAIEVKRIKRTLMGKGCYMLAVMRFQDKEALKSAMLSPEMQAAGDNLNSFAEGLVTLMYASDAK